MDDRTKIATLLAEVDELTPGGFALGLQIGLRGPRFLFTTFPHKWMETYTTRGLQLRDPAVAWSLSNSGWAQWRDLREQDAEFFDLAHDHGLKHGATMAIVGGQSRSVLGCCRDDRDYLDAELSSIAEPARALHDVTIGQNTLPEALSQDLKSMSIRLSQA